MSGPPMNGDLQECPECGRTLTSRTVKLSDESGCVFCQSGDDE